MSQLHELLAVEGSREAAANAVLKETEATFTKKHDHFLAKHSIYKPFDESQMAEEQEELSKQMVETVDDKLKHCLDILGKAFDVTASKDATNTKACASIQIEGADITGPLPATTLLTLEKKFKHLYEVFLQIPTLSPGGKWEIDPAKGENVYRDMTPDARFRTKKVIQHKILVEPTEHHPAQVERWTEDVKVGKMVDTVWSSMISPANKSRLLARTQDLIAATKQARQRANCETVIQVKISDQITNFLLG